MAQRAYRQRKESTLDELRRRVNELVGAVDSMGAIFQDSCERLVHLGLPDPAVHELRVTASRLTGLRETAIQVKDGSMSDDEPAPSKAMIANAMNALVTSEVTSPRNVSVWLDQDELNRGARRSRVDDSIGMGYTILLPGEEQNSATTDFWRTQLAGMQAPVPGMSPEIPVPDFQSTLR